MTGEQQQQSKNKKQTQDQLSSPLSQVLKTSDSCNFENCGLNAEIHLIYHCLHSHLYHMSRNLHKRALIEFWTFIPLFLFFNTFNLCFQDASAWVTEGLALKV